LLLWHLQPFPSPDPLHSLVVYYPAVSVEQGDDASIPIPPILRGIANDGSSQPFLVIRLGGLVTLSRTRLLNHPADPAF